MDNLIDIRPLFCSSNNEIVMMLFVDRRKKESRIVLFGMGFTIIYYWSTLYRKRQMRSRTFVILFINYGIIRKYWLSARACMHVCYYVVKRSPIRLNS